MGIDPPPKEVLSTRIIYQWEVLHFKKITVNSSVAGIEAREITARAGAVTLVPIIGARLILIRQSDWQLERQSMSFLLEP